MFERYTEKARRVIFFGRYEASQFGSHFIETEHLLLGMLREDKALAHRYLKSGVVIESIRKQIEQHVHPGEKVATSVDLPLSHESKRILAFGAEESDRLGHRHIGTDHLLLGILREENCFAAQILFERGLRLDPLRDEVAQTVTDKPQRGAGPVQANTRESASGAAAAQVGRLLEQRSQAGDVIIAREPRVGLHRPDFAIYAGSVADIDGELLGQDSSSPAAEIALVKQKIKLIVGQAENAIANHEFEKARFYANEERKERENFRVLRERHGIQEDAAEPQPVPFLCIQIARDETLAQIQRAIDECLTAGAAEVWLLLPDLKRAYTADAVGGWREWKGDVLRFEQPLIQLPLREVFP